jgi:hypothetical protein
VLAGGTGSSSHTCARKHASNSPPEQECWQAPQRCGPAGQGCMQVLCREALKKKTNDASRPAAWCRAQRTAAQPCPRPEQRPGAAPAPPPPRARRRAPQLPATPRALSRCPRSPDGRACLHALGLMRTSTTLKSTQQRSCQGGAESRERQRKQRAVEPRGSSCAAAHSCVAPDAGQREQERAAGAGSARACCAALSSPRAACSSAARAASAARASAAAACSAACVCACRSPRALQSQRRRLASWADRSDGCLVHGRVRLPPHGNAVPRAQTVRSTLICMRVQRLPAPRSAPPARKPRIRGQRAHPQLRHALLHGCVAAQRQRRQRLHLARALGRLAARVGQRGRRGRPLALARPPARRAAARCVPGIPLCNTLTLNWHRAARTIGENARRPVLRVLASAPVRPLAWHACHTATSANQHALACLHSQRLWTGLSYCIPPAHRHKQVCVGLPCAHGRPLAGTGPVAPCSAPPWRRRMGGGEPGSSGAPQRGQLLAQLRHGGRRRVRAGVGAGRARAAPLGLQRAHGRRQARRICGRFVEPGGQARALRVGLAQWPPAGGPQRSA